MSKPTPSFFATPSLVSFSPVSEASLLHKLPVSHRQDHAFAGLGAGTVAVLCMHPLDLLKVKFQVDTTPFPSYSRSLSPFSSFMASPAATTGTAVPPPQTIQRLGVGRKIYYALRDIKAQDGWRGLYRGVGPNIAGNASSWGLYFLLCVTHSTMTVCIH
jgi:hypothetical protein